MTTLTISVPGQPSRTVKLERDRYTIGRTPGNDILIDQQVVSRNHAVLERTAEGWTCTDLDSRNGTRLEGNRIQKILLKDGMQLKLGKDPRQAVTLTFQMAEAAKVPTLYQEARPGEVKSAVAAPEQTRVDTSETCPNCHVPIRPDSPFCPSCGTNLNPARSERTLETAGVVISQEFIVHDEQGGMQGYELSAPVMKVGRAPDNDIVLKSKLVSNHHLQVNIQAGRVAITDLNSTNGTQVNGVRIPANQSRVLNPGDVIRIGDLTGNSMRITYGSLAGGGLRTREVEKLDLGKLAKQPSVLIGRSSTCDMTMAHPNVSKHHAMLTRDQRGIWIRDLGSTNGTFVNGVRITQAALRDGDEIQIGPFSLVYDGRMQNLAGSQRLGHRLDAIHLVKQVKGGFIILNNVSLSIQSSEFVALVGGSGAGKSTLMKALNGYEPATKGQLLIDGDELYPRLDMYRTEMGYVPQDDIIHRVLPVRLALWYAAKLRLPDASEHEIQKSIDDALKAVEMTEHQIKRVRDLSGGQRKRVSIASRTAGAADPVLPGRTDLRAGPGAGKEDDVRPEASGRPGQDHRAGHACHDQHRAVRFCRLPRQGRTARLLRSAARSHLILRGTGFCRYLPETVLRDRPGQGRPAASRIKLRLPAACHSLSRHTRERQGVRRGAVGGTFPQIADLSKVHLRSAGGGRRHPEG